MKLKSLFLSALCMLSLSMAFTSCSDDDEEDGSNLSGEQRIELPSDRVYILNEGKYGSNNAGIDFYSPASDAAGSLFIGNIYMGQNGIGLGDTGQDLIEYDGSLYATVYNSNILVKMNNAGVKVGEISFTETEGAPRYMVAEDGKLYVTLYSGNVMRIDARTLEKEGMVQVGMNPEQIVEEDNKLYVVNGGWGAGKTMSVIDLATFTLEKTVEVAVNPEKVLESEDKIFIQSYGGAYPDYTYPVEMYDPATGSLTTVGHATNFAEYDGVIYMVYSETDWNTYTTTSTFSSYNVKTGRLSDADFLQNMPDEIRHGSIYMMSIDSENGDFYLSVSDYTTNGTMYRFNHQGVLLDKRDCYGMNPKKAVFVD